MAFFLSAEVKRGPLARIWLASHLGDRKLTKAQLLSTSIIKSIDAIVSAEKRAIAAAAHDEEGDEDGEEEIAAVPMALRLSGQLLLGVARIYSRKAKYLVDDCNDALLKIRMTFKTGATTSVDLSADQTRAAKSAITRQDDTNEFDLIYADMYDDWNIPPPPTSTVKSGKKVATANDADITLPDNDFDLLGDRYGGLDDFSGGIDSQIYLGDDPEEGLDENVFEEDMLDTPTRVGQKRRRESKAAGELDLSVELGRDAPDSAARKSARLSSDGARMDEFEQDFNEIGGYGGADITFDDMPLGGGGGDFDLGFDDMPPMDEPRENVDPEAPRAGSPDNAPARPDDIDVTPRTAKRVNDQALQRAAKKKASKPRPPRKQIVDEVTELEASQSAVASPAKRRAVTNGDGESQQQPSQSLARSGADGRADRVRLGLIVEDPAYLPRSHAHLRLLEIEADPAAFYLPRIDDKAENVFVGEIGLAPELAELFTIPLAGRRKRDGKDGGVGGSPSKRARAETEGGDDLSVELGRRAPSVALSDRPDGFVNDGWDNLDYGGGNAPDESGFQFDLDGVQREATPSALDRHSVRLSTPAPGKPSEGPLAVFDAAPLSAGRPRSVTPASQATPSKSQSSIEHGSAWSKNTLKAVQVITDELDGDLTASVSFDAVAAQASRQAAASFFFECLVLSTRDRISLSQAEPYADVAIKPKPRFWEVDAVAVA